MAESVESTVSSVAAIAVPRRTIWQRIPWLWSDFASRALVPLWVLSFLIFALLYGMGILLAIIAGELPRFLADFRWLGPLGFPAFASYTLGYLPRILNSLINSIRPWLNDPEEKIEAFRANLPEILMRFFWPLALVWGAGISLPGLIGARGFLSQGYLHPEIFRNVALLASPIFAYFVAGAVSAASVGLGIFAHRLRQLDLKRGFILEGSKAALRPFSRLLWVVWATFTIPALLIASYIFAGLAPELLTTGLIGYLELLGFGLFFVGLFATILMPQIFMNQWLAHEKAEEIQALQSELAQVAALSETVGSAEVQKKILRHQHLVYQLHQAEAFKPTLVGTGLFVQVGTSVAVLIMANILTRTIFTGIGS